MAEQEDIVGIIATAIKAANLTNTDAGSGSTQDNIWRSNEDSIHQAKEALKALAKAGYQITKIPKA